MIKSPWDNPGTPTPDASGAGVTARGGDPLIDQGGSSGLKPLWPDPALSSVESKETSNSVSGLPLQPARFEPSGTPPQPPSLKDRNPGTIDER
jgi:hypothetical protein